jgi:hypothetical protein
MVPVADEGQVTVHRGKAVGFYFCAPNCDQAVAGDANAADVAQASALSTSSDAAPSGGPAAPGAAPVAASLHQ